MVKKTYILIIILSFFLLLINFISASNVGLIENLTWQNNLTGVRFSTTAFGDIDGDGDLDLFLTGCLSAGASDCNNGAISKIYINNGTSLVENSTWQQNLTGAGYGSLSLGDINNDGDLDLALSGCPSGTETSCDNVFSKIYINNGTTLTENSLWQNNLTGTYSGSTKLVDINNDGKLDIALTGSASTSRISKIYINNGTSLVENSTWQQNLTGVRYSSLAFADINNDGWLDIGLVGADNSNNNYAGLYLNNGTSLIHNSIWSTNLALTNLGSYIFGDIDNDGYLDLAEMGIGDYLYTYRNNGTTFIKNQSSGASEVYLAGVYEGSFAFGDYDNDGDLDLIATGYEQGRGQIYENNASRGNYFITDNIAGAGIHADDFLQNALAWVDLDKDNNLDLILSGVSWGSGFLESNIYLSNASLTKNNTLPTPPSTFTSTYSNNVLTLVWNNGSDAETNSTGLYYNIMVGNSTTNNTIVSGVYGGSSGGGNAGGGASGYFGNMMQRKNITLNVELQASETYNWYVQTIDTGLAKSEWSTVQSFITSADVTKPTVILNPSSPNADLHTANPVFVFNASVVDANVKNVTLYSDWTGSMIVNETNLSAITANYSFTKDLTGLSDGLYSWYIYVCDTSSNCQSSGTRTFYLDRVYPLVYSESPANGDTWTSSSTVTFSYNVSDTDVANCSLIINGAIDQTDTTISESASQSFTKTLSNADYTWNVNCTDYVNYKNSSGIRSLTVSYTAPVSSSGGGGGGGSSQKTNATAISPEIKVFDVDFSTATTGIIEAKQGDVKTFSFQGEVKHSITTLTITSSSITLLITSEPITIQINLNEIKQIDINRDEINDLEIKLDSIISGKAKFSLTKLPGADIAAQEEIEEAIKKEALFDVKVSITNWFKIIKSGRDVIANIEVLNVNNIGQVDVLVNYYITDKENNTIAEGSDTLAVEAVASFVRSLAVPYNVKSENYYFNVEVKYKDELMASGHAEFKVIRNYEVIVAVGVVVLIVAGIFVYLWRIRKKEEKLESKEKKLEREISKLKDKKNKKWQK